MCKKKAQPAGPRPPKTIICIATGPSLTQEDCEAAAKAEIIAVNDSFRLVPDADCLYACDQRWWQHHIEEVNRIFKGEKFTQYRTKQEKEYAEANGITPIEGQSVPGLGREKLHFNRNSGAQAINLAYFRGATRIILLGYDMQKTGGKAHWFGDHPQGLSNGDYASYVGNFDRLAEDLKAEDIEVINCSRNTALWQFPIKPLDEVLCQI